MPKLYSSNSIIKILIKNGFVCVSQKGSHVKYRKNVNDEPSLTVIVPANKKEIPFGTFRAICIQSNIDQLAFKKK